MSKKIKEAEDLFTMKMHEERNVSLFITVMRVPGGWIYTQQIQICNAENYLPTSTYVPESMFTPSSPED